MRSIGQVEKDVVYVEGGLGSQLLSMLVYLQRRELEPEVRADVSYFNHGLSEPTDDVSGLTGWPWEMNRYGYKLADFGSIKTRIRVRPAAKSRAAEDAHYLASAKRRDWSEAFPIQSSAFELLRHLGLDADSAYTCVHVRRGDYLRVSSRVVHLSESLGAVKRLGGLATSRIVFLSDDEFTLEEQEKVAGELVDHQCSFVSGSDQHAAHGLIRMSSVLVTSNSTSSFSAGLLSLKSGAVVLSPTTFSLQKMKRQIQSFGLHPTGFRWRRVRLNFTSGSN